ncbi:MAG TPA: cell division protein ZapB [Candidatus Deferrimicrobium sp.]|nr:cell division protein ZapB [Candidatus Deferrimicrobium sp.]
MLHEKLDLLAKRVEQLVAVLQNVKQENLVLKQENAGLAAELAALKAECRELRLGRADRSEQVRTRLTAILGRLEELESLQQ